MFHRPRVSRAVSQDFCAEVAGASVGLDPERFRLAPTPTCLQAAASARPRLNASMSASRRLPLATLARVSRGRRRGGKLRLALALLAIAALLAAAVWAVRLRQTRAEVLPPAAEILPAVASEAGPDGSTPENGDASTSAPAPREFSFAAPPAGTITTPAEPLAGGTAPAAPTANGPTLSKPTPPTPQATTPSPAPEVSPVETDFRPRLPRDVFEAQVALVRDAICPGSIDGSWGGQTRNAVAAYQEKHGLRVTGQLDNPTREALKLRESPLRYYTVTENDISRLRPWPKGWLPRSELDFMGYSSVLEMVAERSCTNPKHIMRLNPQVDWTSIKAGTQLVVPHIGVRAAPSSRPEYILISLSAKTLQLYDAENRLLAHFPCSIARRVEKRPVGELSVLTVALNPNYTFNPETFPDSPEAQKVGRKLILQPGPNNPVGTAWIALSAGDGSYGIHGSPEPEQIGRTESSGCFRLANWNAEYLAPLVRSGMLVRVEP